MEENFYDLVMEEMLAIGYEVKKELRQQFKKTNPPRMVKISPQKMIEEFQNLTPQHHNALKTVYGEDAHNGYMEYMNNLMGTQNG